MVRTRKDMVATGLVAAAVVIYVGYLIVGDSPFGFSALATGSSVLLALFMASVVGLWWAAVYVSTHGHPLARVHAQL